MTGLTPAPVDAEITADDIEGDFTPLARPDVASVAIESEMVLGRIAAGTQYVQTCALNESGAVVWQCFDGTGTIADIAADIAEVFGVDFEAVNADVVALARNVGSLGFLVGVREDTFDVGDGDAGTEGIAIGEPFPDFDAIDETGGGFSSKQLRGRRFLLVNWSSTCSFCEAIVDDLAELAPALGRVGVGIVLLAAGDQRVIRESIDRAGLACRLLVHGDAGDAGFDGIGTPVAYLLDEQGNVASPLALGAPPVVQLAREIAESTDLRA